MPPSDPLTRTGTDLRESSPLLSPPVLADSHVDAQSYGDDEPGLTHFPPGSSLNPRNWPESRKWLIVAAITPTDLSVSWAASGFSPAEGKFAEEFGVSEEIARLGLSLYVLGIALGPMFLAPLSEVLGRNGIYTCPYAAFLMLLACTTVAPSVLVFMVLRFFSGLFAAVTIGTCSTDQEPLAANFGGTIADLWSHAQTGRAMSVYLWAATCGSPSGFFFLSAVAQHHGWRTVFWTILAMNGTCWALMVVALWGNETRHTTILRRKVRRVAQFHEEEQEQEQEQALERGDGQGRRNSIRLPVVPRRRSAREIVQVALTRPFHFLLTEAIVIFGALYNGFLYGLSFLFNVAFVQVFGRSHGFSTFGVGCAFLGIVAGISIGPLTNLWQERHYQLAAKGGIANAPEARVQLSKIAAVLLPLSLFWFAWTTGEAVPVAAPIAACVCWGWSFYTLILMTFQYTEDAYRVFSASALAGIGLVRNVAGAAFPLLGQRLFATLGGPQWGVSLLSLVAIIMAPIPFILERYGFELRKRSPWARQHVADLDDRDAER